MAEGLLRSLKSESWEASSAGTEPSRVHPLAVEAMREVGIDISGHRSKHLREFDGQEFDRVVTLCGGAHAACPFFAGAREMRHRGFDDPSAGGIEQFRQCRDEIRKWLMEEFSGSHENASPVRF
jgi:arsenate reductase